MAINAVGELVREGKEIVCGSGDFDASGELEVATGFAHIDAVAWSIESDSAPATTFVTHSVDGGEVTFHAWEPTAADNSALTASNAEMTVSYVIVGRRWNN
jgi:hypothetical protein